MDFNQNYDRKVICKICEAIVITKSRCLKYCKECRHAKRTAKT